MMSLSIVQRAGWERLFDDADISVMTSESESIIGQQTTQLCSAVRTENTSLTLRLRCKNVSINSL